MPVSMPTSATNETPLPGAGLRRYTPEEFALLPGADGFELVDGKLEEKRMGAESGWVAGILYGYLFAYLVENPLGYLFPADVGYQCFPFSPGMVRKPDASFIRLDRLGPQGPPKGWITIAPDLAIESLSPGDLASEIDTKVQQYLRAGVKVVWVIQPEIRTVLVNRADRTTARLFEEDSLDGEDLLPGFRCQVANIFQLPGLAQRRES
jgi:Uma2 family endonuclease